MSWWNAWQGMAGEIIDDGQRMSVQPVYPKYAYFKLQD